MPDVDRSTVSADRYPARLRRSAALAAGATMILLATGCGSSSHGGSNGTGLSRVLARPGEEPGFSEPKGPIISSSLSSWVSMYEPSVAATAMKQFRTDGWQSGANVTLAGPNGAGGSSSVDEFASRAGATAE